MPSYRLLRDGHFRRLWISTAASGLATWALPFVLALSLVSGEIDARTLGSALAGRTVGFLGALPVAGVMGDRASRQRVIGWSAIVGAGAAAALVWAVGQSPAVVVLFVTTAGIAEGACRPAFQAMVADVVPTTARQSANAAITLAVRGSVLLGPALASSLAAAIGTSQVLLMVSALWLVAGSQGLVRAPVTASPPATSRTASTPGWWAAFAEGLQEARVHTWFVGGLGALAAVIVTGYSVTAVVLPLISRDRFGSELLLATGLTGYTAGAIVGALVMSRWRPRAQGWWALAGLAAYTGVPLTLAFETPAPVVVGAYVVAGCGLEVFNVAWFTAIQREVRPGRLSRVSSLDFLVSYGLAPIGLALVVPLVDAVGRQPVLLVCAVVCAVGPGLAALLPTSREFASSPMR